MKQYILRHAKHTRMCLLFYFLIILTHMYYSCVRMSVLFKVRQCTESLNAYCMQQRMLFKGRCSHNFRYRPMMQCTKKTICSWNSKINGMLPGLY